MFAPKGLGEHWALLIGGDILCIAVGMIAAVSAGTAPNTLGVALDDRGIAIASVGLAHVIALYFQDLYTIDRPRTDAWVIVSTIAASSKLAVLFLILRILYPSLAPGHVIFLIYLPLSTLCLLVWRFTANSLFFARFNLGVMALGFVESLPLIIEEIQKHNHLGYRFQGVATFSAGPAAQLRDKQGLVIQLGSSLAEMVRRHSVAILVVLDPAVQASLTRELVQCRVQGVEVFDLESFYERISGKLPLPYLRESWLTFAPGFGGTRWRLRVKRVLDVVLALAMGILFLPLAVITALCIKLDSKGPILYSQRRVGLGGTTFSLYKFRSMDADAEKSTGAVWASRKDPRITRVGRIIRRMRVDEIPQIINVLRGEMSFVGPRPERPEMVANLAVDIPLYEYRHFVRPGLTGWAQVCYPYGASVDDAREKLCYDLYYIKNWSLSFDLQIMLQTTKVVIFGRGGR